MSDTLHALFHSLSPSVGPVNMACRSVGCPADVCLGKLGVHYGSFRIRGFVATDTQTTAGARIAKEQIS